MNRSAIFRFFQFALCALQITWVFPESGFSHGYVSSPKSRSLLCNQNANINCGHVQYEPQSVEGEDGFPGFSVPDGQIASAGLAKWGQLNEQSAARWSKNLIQSGFNSFSWHFTAPHATRDWKYFITKSNWNPNSQLTRDSFDLNPFCTQSGGMAVPSVNTTHVCNVPGRQGYHVILALWDVGDTTKTFYQVIDVQFQGTGTNDIVLPEKERNTPTDTPKETTTLPTTSNCEGGSTISPSSGDRNCKAISSVTNDSWCTINCNHSPSFCPANLCSCEGDNQPRPNLKECNALPGSQADDAWCNVNCNHIPSFCPENFCQCS